MSKRELNGKELQGFIKQRQARQVKGLNKSLRLVILMVGDNDVSSFYTRVKQGYGEDIGIGVDNIKLDSWEELETSISELNNDESVDGVIVQLPIAGIDDPQSILDKIAPHKDIDGLGDKSNFSPATAVAILWLLNGYNIQLEQGKKIVIVGKGKLVGEPLLNLMLASEYNVEAIDEFTEDKEAIISSADILISAAGSPGLVTPDLVKQNAVVVDAGTTSVKGTQVGDVEDAVYSREDIIATPKGGQGGVGPLTVAALFDNVIISASS